MTTPAWTVREWQPLVRQLLTALRSDDAERAEDGESPSTAADRAVAALYAHRFLEPSQQQVATELEEVATKLEVHSLGARARRLRALASTSVADVNALKLLLALAEAPTAASDDATALDEPLAAVRAQQQRESVREQEQEVLRERLVEELFEVATTDEWYEQWADDSDEDMSDSDNDDDSVGDRGGGSSEWSGHASFRIGVQQKESETEPQEKAEEEVASSAAICRTSGDDEDLEEEEQDELLLRYFPLAASPSPLPSTSSDGATDAEMSESDAGVVEEEEEKKKSATKTPAGSSSLSLEHPQLLYSAIQRQRVGGFAHRLVHERSLVAAVFQALAGIDSFVLDVVPPTAAAAVQWCFHDSHEGSSCVRLSEAARGVAVSHLSPTALHRFLELFATAATELQQMRDFVACVTRDSFNSYGRCCTLEGLAHALSTVVRDFEREVSSVEQRLEGEGEVPATHQATLLAVYGNLKPLFSTVAWLKRVLVTCFRADSNKATADASAAERAKSVLDSLYTQLEVEYIQGIHDSRDTLSNVIAVSDRDAVEVKATARTSRYGVVLHLFVHAVSPYLDLLQNVLFERGYADTLALHDELFFTAPLAARRGSHAPSSPLVDTESPPSFKDVLLALAPFEVDARLVPVFLTSAIPLLNEAIASRQMTNRYLQQRDVRVDDSAQQRPLSATSLSELFVRALVASGVYHHDHADGESEPNGESIALSTRRSVQNIPFGRTIKQCLLQHVEQKCHELNGAMATLFRDRLHFLDHVDALRAFVLMQQQDVFAMTSAHLLQQMQQNPITWADSERINSFFHSAMHRMYDERVVTSAVHHAGSRLCVRVNATQLKALGVATKLDISALRCLYFTFAAPQPLRVLFSASVMRKYSRLAALLLQVKAVESAIIKFKRNLRYNRCFKHIESDLRGVLLQLSDMLHCTKTLMSYLSSQVSNSDWNDVRHVLETSESLVAMDRAHEQYLDQLLNTFFLLDKNKKVVQYILTTFNHIMRFTSQANELVKAVERNLPHYVPSSTSAKHTVGLGVLHDDDDANSSRLDSGTGAMPSGKAKARAPLNILRRSEHKLLQDEMAKSASEFKRHSHFLVVLLNAMHKHGASPHIAEILTQLNYNYFYHPPQDAPQHPLFVTRGHMLSNARS